MKRLSILFGMLSLLLLIGVAAYAAENTTWGSVKDLFNMEGMNEDRTPELSQSDEATPLAKKASGEGGDPAVLALMHAINDKLAAQGLNIAIEEIVFFTIGQGRPSNRIHQQSQGFRRE